MVSSLDINRYYMQYVVPNGLIIKNKFEFVLIDKLFDCSLNVSKEQ